MLSFISFLSAYQFLLAQFHRSKFERGVGKAEALARVLVGDGGAVVVAQEVQVAQEGVAGNFLLADEAAAVWKRTSSSALANHFQYAMRRSL